MRNSYYYLIRTQYLGFRYSGWQQQPGQRTVEGMLQKTLDFVLPDRDYKILASGRTDAKVSALGAGFELFLEDKPLDDLISFSETMNRNLPADIRSLGVEEVGPNFNIIKDCRAKQYVYIFSYGQKNHPFAAPFMANFPGELNVELMKRGAALYQGDHDFRAYTPKSERAKDCRREIHSIEIVENRLLEASFFPETSYLLRVEGPGFLRYQIRMIMGALVKLGSGKMSLEGLKRTLEPGNSIELDSIAPGSGLLLETAEFEF